MKHFLSFIMIGISWITVAQDQWLTLNPVPTSRYGAAAVVLNDSIYLIGGEDSTGLKLDVVEVYDPISDMWVTKAPLNLARTMHGAEVVNGRIYVIGGYTGISDTNSVEMYDFVTDTWTIMTPMQISRSAFGSGVIDGEIYIAGGQPGDITALEIYDPVNDSWSFGNSFATGRHNNNGAAVVNGILYYMGGESSQTSAIFDMNDAYDPLLDAWYIRAPIPIANNGGGATTLYGAIHYMGGTEQAMFGNGEIQEHFVYDPVMNSWSSALSLTSKRSGHAIVTHNDKIYVMGGMNDSNNWLYLNQVFVPCIDVSVSQSGGTLTADIGGLSYQWLDCADNYAPIPGATGQSYLVTTTGYYAVEITSGSCVDTSTCTYVDLTGLEELYTSGKDLVKIVDLMGRETKDQPNTVLIYVYSDGTAEKVCRIE